MQVGLLTPEQKVLLEGVQYKQDCYFNPILDNNGLWIISQEEMTQIEDGAYGWVSEIPLIEFEPIPYNIDGE